MLRHYRVIIGASLQDSRARLARWGDVKVDLVYLVYLVEPDKLEKPDEPDKPQTRRTAFMSILSAG
jgi:hypothetical protein